MVAIVKGEVKPDDTALSRKDQTDTPAFKKMVRQEQGGGCGRQRRVTRQETENPGPLERLCISGTSESTRKMVKRRCGTLRRVGEALYAGSQAFGGLCLDPDEGRLRNDGFSLHPPPPLFIPLQAICVYSSFCSLLSPFSGASLSDSAPYDA